MTKALFNIGILCSRERYTFFLRALASHDIAAKTKDGRPLHPADFPAKFDWAGALRAWEEQGVEIAVVDDESFADKEAMISGLRQFCARAGERRRLRVIFVADVRRSATDEVFSRLASMGIWDVVSPGNASPLADQLCVLIAEPAVAPSAPEGAAGVEASAAAPEGVRRKESSRSRSGYGARGKSVIAVSGIMPRSGATNCSIVLARTLAMLGQKPALVVDKRTGSGLSKGYKSAAADDGKSYRINGVDIFPEVTAAQVPRKYSHVVVDLGYLGWGKKETTEEEKQKFAEFSKADLQVVYLPCTSPADFEYVSRFYSEQTAADLERYAIGVWGATDGLFAMLQEKFRSKAPEVFMWNVDVYRWPLSLDAVAADMVEVLRPVLPRGVADKAAQGAVPGAGAEDGNA